MCYSRLGRALARGTAVTCARIVPAHPVSIYSTRYTRGRHKRTRYYHSPQDESTGFSLHDDATYIPVRSPHLLPRHAFVRRYWEHEHEHEHSTCTNAFDNNLAPQPSSLPSGSAEKRQPEGYWCFQREANCSIATTSKISTRSPQGGKQPKPFPAVDGTSHHMTSHHHGERYTTRKHRFVAMRVKNRRLSCPQRRYAGARAARRWRRRRQRRRRLLRNIKTKRAGNEQTPRRPRGTRQSPIRRSGRARRSAADKDRLAAT